MDNIFTWLVTGAVFGLVVIALDKGQQRSAPLRIVFGLIGGCLGGWLLTAFEVIKLGGTEGDVVRAGAGAALFLLLARMFD